MTDEYLFYIQADDMNSMFRKAVDIPKVNRPIGYNNELVTLGSCFSDSVGKKLNEAGFTITQNPFGTIFHPIALAELIDGIDLKKMLQRDNYYFHWQLGGTYFYEDQEEFRNQLDSLRENVQAKIASANVVMVTFGTAWGYVLKEDGNVVANCHKMSQNLFSKELFSSEDITKKWKNIVRQYPDKNWLFTVSPVRHWKDGVRENNVSKGVLHQVIHELLNEENVDYFPAYEIMLDELRDYRFYENDYLHPNKEAVDYIWKRFRETFFSDETDDLVGKVEKLNLAKLHRPLLPNSSGAKEFLLKTQELEQELKERITKAKS